MSERMDGMEMLGRQVAGEIGEGPGGRAMAMQEMMVVDAVSAPRRSRATAFYTVAVASVAVAVLAGAGVFLVSGHGRMGFRIAGVAHDGQESVWLHERTDVALDVAFDDGTRIVMQKTARGRILRADRNAVSIALDSGTLSAQVMSAGRTLWVIDAGPYRVTVTGTVFDVSWQPADGLLDVLVRAGKVAVTGAGLAEGGLSLATGHNLHVDEKRGRTIIDTGSSQPASTSAVPSQDGVPAVSSPASLESRRTEDAVAPRPGVVSARESPRGRPAPSAAARRTASIEGPRPGAVKEKATGDAAPRKTALIVPDDWKDLQREGRYAESLAAAEKAGFDVLTGTLDLADLWALADAARYAKSPRKVEKALLAVRKRFGDSPRARAAAYLLGKTAMDLDRNPAEAARWFRTYLREDPDGSLAEEALGRLVDACVKSNQRDAAKDAARRYLEKYLNGTFSDLARSVLEE